MKARVCELCSEEASLYCASDAAFLCLDCDAKVHQANFLVARHLRQPLCSKCNQVSAVLPLPLRPICSSCLPEKSSVDDHTLSSSSSSAYCVSSTESCATATKTKTKTKREKVSKRCVSSTVTEVSGGEVAYTPARLSLSAKAEGIMVIWCGKLGVNGNLVVPSATRALGFCLSRWTVLPFRVSVAASFWLGMRFCGDKSLSMWQNMRRLEEVSGVPAKLILAAEAKLARAVMARTRARRVLEERWAESQCSV